jgi:hypothetical protein
VNKRKEKGRGCYAPARVSQPPKPGHIGQTLNAREFSYSTCCTLQPLVARQFRGRGFGLESTADVLLTKPSIRTSWASPFYGFCRKNREPTSGLEPLACSLRVIIQALQEVAQVCKSRISKRLSLHRFAPCCTVLRSRWCQSGVTNTLASTFAFVHPTLIGGYRTTQPTSRPWP